MSRPSWHNQKAWQFRVVNELLNYKMNRKLQTAVITCFALFSLVASAVDVDPPMPPDEPGAQVPVVQVGYASQARGVDAESVFQIGDIENINLYNGNISLSIPLGPAYPLNGGQKYQLSMHYNANPWDPVQARCQLEDGGPSVNHDVIAWLPQFSANAGLGWELSLGRVLKGEFEDISLPDATTNNYPENNGRGKADWVYVAPDGARHRFQNTFPIGLTEEENFSVTGEMWYSQPDGRMRLEVVSFGLQVNIHFTDGSIHEFTNIGSPDWPDYRPSKIYYGHSSFNNYIEINYDKGTNRVWTITDSMGRTHRVNFHAETAGGERAFHRLKKVRLSGVGGSTIEYGFAYRENQTVDMHKGVVLHSDMSYNCLQNQPLAAARHGGQLPTDWTHQVDLLSRIVQPDGQFYQFYYYQYDTNPDDPNGGPPVAPELIGKAGAISQVRLPTGLRYQYRYTGLSGGALNRPGINMDEAMSGYIFSFHGGGRRFISRPASFQSGIAEKEVFRVEENNGFDFSDPAPVPAVDEVNHYGLWSYIQSHARYEAYPDTLIPPQNSAWRPCYLKRTVVDPVNRQSEYYFTNAGQYNPRTGEPYTMCDPLMAQEDGDSNYFGKRGVGADPVPPSPGYLWSGAYAADGTGPFLSKLIRDVNGKVVQSEWVKMDALTKRFAPDQNNVITVLSESRHHDESENVIARKQTRNEHFDGFGHFGVTRSMAWHTDYGSINSAIPNWGNEKKAINDYFLTDPDQLYITVDHNPGTCDSTSVQSWGCMRLNRVGEAQLHIDDSTSWWMLDAMPMSTSGETIGGGFKHAVIERCYDEQNGFRIGERKWLGNNRSPKDLLQRFELESIGAGQYSGNLGKAIMFGGDMANLDNTEACPAIDIAKADRIIEYQYAAGVNSYSQIVDCDGIVIKGSVNHIIDASTGSVIQSVDPAGISIVYDLEPYGRLKGSRVADKAWTKYRYIYPHLSGTEFIANTLSFEKLTCTNMACDTGYPPGHPPENALTWNRSEYDPRGLTVKKVMWLPRSHDDPVTSPRLVQTRIAFDVMGRRTWTSVAHPYIAGQLLPNPDLIPGGVGVTQMLDYDVYNRPLRIMQPDGSAIEMDYDRNDNHISAVTSGVQLEGGEQDVTHVTIKDGWGRVVYTSEALESTGGSTADIESSYAYDYANRLTRVCVGDNDAQQCAGGQQRIFDYDGRGVMFRGKHPEIFDDSSDYSYYFYDGASRVIQADVPGMKFDQRISYDPAGRLAQTHELHGQQRLLTEFAYANSNDGINKSKDRLVRRKRHQWIKLGSDGEDTPVTVTESYRYEDAAGLPTHFAIQTSLGTRFESTISEYDALGNPHSLEYPTCSIGNCTIEGDILDYHYQKGVLTAVGFRNQPGEITNINYFDNGMLEGIRHANDLLDQHYLDAFQWRLERIENTGLGWTHGPIEYDAAGNISAIGSDHFYYDGLGRMLYGEVTGHDGNQYQQHASYDQFGNILQLNHGPVGLPAEGGPGAIAVNANNNRLEGGIYNEMGDLQSWEVAGSQFSYQYDPMGRMRQLIELSGDAEFSYLYNASGERLAILDLNNQTIRWTPRTVTNHIARRITSGLDMQGWALERDYIHANGVQISAHKSDGSTTYFHTDHSGSTRKISDATGALIAENDYYPFGGYVLDPNDDEALQFTGHERDIVSQENSLADLDYMHARYYFPYYGRFLSVDPVLGNTASSQSWNRFSYANNDPVGLIDPDGRDEIGGKIIINTNDESLRGKIMEVLIHAYMTTEGKARIDKVTGISGRHNRNINIKTKPVSPSAIIDNLLSKHMDNSPKKEPMDKAEKDLVTIVGEKASKDFLPSTVGGYVDAADTTDDSVTMVLNEQDLEVGSMGGLVNTMVHELMHAGAAARGARQEELDEQDYHSDGVKGRAYTTGDKAEEEYVNKYFYRTYGEAKAAVSKKIESIDEEN